MMNYGPSTTAVRMYSITKEEEEAAAVEEEVSMVSLRKCSDNTSSNKEMVAEEVEEEEDRAISTLARIFHYSKLPITKLIVNSNSCCLEMAIYIQSSSVNREEKRGLITNWVLIVRQNSRLVVRSRI